MLGVGHHAQERDISRHQRASRVSLKNNNVQKGSGGTSLDIGTYDTKGFIRSGVGADDPVVVQEESPEGVADEIVGHGDDNLVQHVRDGLVVVRVAAPAHGGHQITGRRLKGRQGDPLDVIYKLWATIKFRFNTRKIWASYRCT